MRKPILLFLLAFVSLTLNAQIPNGYYNTATGKTGDELKVALHNIIKGHTVKSYDDLLTIFKNTDNDGSGNVWDIYSNCTFSYSGNKTCGSYKKEGDCWNREHTWPQSWFNESSTPRSDLFHVYPTDGYVNNRRSSYPYGEVDNPTYTSGNGSKLGPCVTSGYSGTVFEPIDEYKGDIARGFFYMSVRYYGEDSGWKTSSQITTGAMTNKSEILPWAMTMLLRWNDEDPVSDKEIARNNVIYRDYQHNRNPFIDHPEYAHMIWDPNWAQGTSYSITCATGLSHGSVSAPESALEGSTVAITATPDPGYQLSGYTVYKSGSPSTTVTVSSNGTFTMPDYAVTVSATFSVNNTYYDITLGSANHGTISTNNVTSAKSGTTINLTATPDSGYSLYSWYVYKTGDMNTTVDVSGNSFVMPAFNVTVMATFVQGSGSNGNYVKVTSTPSDWSGEYLIVCETNSVAFNGTVENGWGRCSSVTITNSSIESDATTENYKVTVSKEGSGYKFLFPDNQYMSWTGAKTFAESPTAVAYSIALSNNNTTISYGSNTLYYNYNSGNGGLRSYSTTGQTPIQLYKKTGSSTPTPTHIIHFNGNGNTGGSMNNQTVNEHEATALNANGFTRTNHVFIGWNTSADGTGTYYADGATVTLLDDLNLYAQWERLYTVNYGTTTNGSISADLTSATEGMTISLTATANSGYEFDHWTVIDEDDNLILVSDNQFEMPASNVTVSAGFVYVGTPYVQQYYLVTSTNQLVAGRKYLIVNTDANMALGTTQNNNNRSGVAVTISDGVISSIGPTVCELTLGRQNGAWTFYDSLYVNNNNTGGYLYAASSEKNYLRTQTNNDANGQWSISITTNGTATIIAQGNNTRKDLRYNPNNNSPIFSCYATDASTSSFPKVELYIRSEEYPHSNNETVANLFAFDKHTIASGNTLTISGTATCTDPNHLIIEDGAQLIHHSDNVKATMKKNVEAYSGDGGWYTIATPFVSCTPSGTMVNDGYDLFAYNEAGPLEWTNYKAGSYDLTANAGYLYAHSTNTILRMTGTLNNGNYTNTVNLSYSNSDNTLKGYNLLGNPTAHEITFTKSDQVSDGYFYIANGDSWVYESGNTVPAGRGFLVKANATGQTVTWNPSSKRDGNVTNEKTALLKINVDGENAYVKITEGCSMPLPNFKGRSSSVYLSREGQPYIMLVRDGANRIDLNYNVPRSGPHRIKVDTKDTELSYLHLFDRLTGADIDLLATPKYLFESSEGDNPARFQLVFSPETLSDQDHFAYYYDGRIVVFGVEGPYELQVIDITGRMVNTPTPGVYVLRLITPEQVRIQKIIIK